VTGGEGKGREREKGGGRERGREGREREGSVPGSFSQILAPGTLSEFVRPILSKVTNGYDNIKPRLIEPPFISEFNSFS